MKQINILAVVLLLGITNTMSYFFGSHEIRIAADICEDGSLSAFYPHCYDIRESLSFERKYCNAWMELAHYYLYDNNPSICFECNDSLDYERERNNYWLDIVSESDYYMTIDSLNKGNWEDWYHNWN